MEAHIMQSKADLEESYKVPDQWGYKTRMADHDRRHYISTIAKMFLTEHYAYRRALDVAAGEGFVTEILPAAYLYGFDISDVAMTRFPQNVKKFIPGDHAEQSFDLVIATGCLYSHYDWQSMVDMALKFVSPTGIILTSNVSAWERPDAIGRLAKDKKQVFEATFPYLVDSQDLTQKLRVFR